MHTPAITCVVVGTHHLGLSSSRQAYRLGTRLDFARLLGFYYGHVGYYVGQLHFYHATYSMLVLAFVGALCEGTGTMPSGVAKAAFSISATVYSTVFVLFFAASLMPLFMVLLVEEGVLSAIVRPLKQVISGAPLYYIFQSRCIGHAISGEFASGGATYIATGRGLATERQDFFCALRVVWRLVPLPGHRACATTCASARSVP